MPIIVKKTNGNQSIQIMLTPDGKIQLHSLAGFICMDSVLDQLQLGINHTRKIPEDMRIEHNNALEKEKYAEISHKSSVINCSPSDEMKYKGYLMRDNRNGLIKIGVSKNPQKRERTFQSEVPQVSMIFSSSRLISLNTEKDIHCIFGDKRVRGEWFRLSADDVEYAKAYMTNH